MSYTAFIEHTLISAAQIANTHFGKVSQTVKAGDNNQVLTEADIAIGKQIVAAIQATYPNHNVIDEEAGVINNESKLTWVVDPIDGTSNFAEGLPTYGIMIGLLENDEPIAGGISLPAFEEVFIGGVDTPATKNGSPVTVSQQSHLLDSLVAYGIDGHQENPDRTTAEVAILKDIILGIRNLRTTNSAYDMAKTVEGKYGVFLNQTTKIWDNVAIQAVIEAAGGVCTDFFGKSIDYSNHLERSQENFTICAGAPQLHTQIQELVATASS